MPTSSELQQAWARIRNHFAICEHARDKDDDALDVIGATVLSSDSERIERLSQAIRDVWPHLTGHCMEGSTPECYGYMRDRLSSVVEGLPYAALPDPPAEGGE
jgi:hypothetical protein